MYIGSGSDVVSNKHPRFIDNVFQCVYWIAYRLHLIWTFLFRPANEGAWIAVWCQGRLLLIKNSYRSTLTLPGGGMDNNETPLAAATRELREEVGIEARPQDLSFYKQYFSLCEFKRDHINLFELELTEQPRIEIDNREVSWAGIFSAEQALELKLFPALRWYLEDKQSD